MIEVAITYIWGYYNGVITEVFTFNTENIEMCINIHKHYINTYLNRFPNIYIQECYNHGDLTGLGFLDNSINCCIGPYLFLCYEIVGGGQYWDICFNNILGNSITYEQFIQDCADNIDNELYQLFMKHYNDMLRRYNNIKQ
jgi:hypothetical protein